MLWHSSGTIENVKGRTSDVNFSVGVANRGRTKVEMAALFYISS